MSTRVTASGPKRMADRVHWDEGLEREKKGELVGG